MDYTVKHIFRNQEDLEEWRLEKAENKGRAYEKEIQAHMMSVAEKRLIDRQQSLQRLADAHSQDEGRYFAGRKDMCLTLIKFLDEDLESFRRLRKMVLESRQRLEDQE